MLVLWQPSCNHEVVGGGGGDVVKNGKEHCQNLGLLFPP